MSGEPNLDFEHWPAGERLDETDVSLRAYLSGFSNERLAEYDPSWTDDQLMAWDGNFRSDGALMLVCCERDVDVGEYRRMLEALQRFRALRRNG
jgi:hypothetical protein